MIDGWDVVFLAKPKDGDYHQEMNSVVFLEWFENQFMPALKNPSLAVLDNASYHNVKTEDTVCPNFSQKKAVLQNYLTQHNILFSDVDTKKVLYEKIKQKKNAVVYKTDKIDNLHGHEVLRTPIGHCELSPIELIWAQVKGFGKTTKDVWTKAEEHVVKIEKEYYNENCIDRSVIEPIIFDFCDDDSDDDTCWSIMILSIIDREKKCKNRINVTLKPMPKIFGTCVC